MTGVQLAGGTAPLPAPTTGAELARIEPDDFIGSEAARTGLGGYAPVDNINIVCVPDPVVS